MSVFRNDLLAGKTALVTGSSRGLGQAIATALAGHGARVAFHGRRAPTELAARWPGSIALGADLTHPGAGIQVVEATVTGFVRLDILVHCAAGLIDGRDVVPGEAGPAELYRPVVVNAAQDAAAAAFNAGAEYIVNIGSIAGFAPEDGYGQAKAELHALTQRLAREMAPSTRVNCIAPGPVEAGGGLLLSETERAAYGREIPLGRLASAEDVANLTVFLVSGAADYLTGQVLSLTGGWVMLK